MFEYDALNRLVAKRSHGKRALSGKRYMLEGRHAWGSKEERDAIRRRAHGVRGHLRKLPDGWQRSEKAVELAREHGISLPDGFTFVQPHVRGHDNGNNEVEVPTTTIQARGVSSLVALLSN